MTEHYTNSSISGNDWGNAMTAAKEIHDCMNAGWAAYVVKTRGTTGIKIPFQVVREKEYFVFEDYGSIIEPFQF
jgi:secreted protein with Ig-like and vWFA domain